MAHEHNGQIPPVIGFTLWLLAGSGRHSLLRRCLCVKHGLLHESDCSNLIELVSKPPLPRACLHLTSLLCRWTPWSPAFRGETPPLASLGTPETFQEPLNLDYIVILAVASVSSLLPVHLQQD